MPVTGNEWKDGRLLIERFEIVYVALDLALDWTARLFSGKRIEMAWRGQPSLFKRLSSAKYVKRIICISLGISTFYIGLFEYWCNTLVVKIIDRKPGNQHSPYE